MFRALKGYKARYQDLTLLVASDFDEWKVLVEGPGVKIHGARQFTEAKAKEHAQAVAESYLREQRHENPAPATLEWQPFEPGEWLNWRP